MGEEITVSRWKIGGYLAISLAFVAIALLFLQHPDEDAWKLKLGLALFAPASAVFVWLLIHPQRLLLDSQGFTLAGGLVWSPKKVYWRDIDSFFVYSLPRGGKMIGYNYKPGLRDLPKLARINRVFGADAALPKGWPKSPEAMVEDLNAYRLRAAGGFAGPPPGAPAGPGRVPTVS